MAVMLAGAVLVSGWLRERSAGSHVAWRKVLILLGSLALLVLIAQPTVKRLVDVQTALVLTPGATRQLAEENGVSVVPSALSVALPGAEPWSSGPARAPDLATFVRRNPQVDQLQILGSGLEPWEMEDLKASVAVVGATEASLGIGAITWRRQLELGDWLQVTGSVVGLSNGKISLSLEGPRTSANQVELSADSGGGPIPFTLQAKPPGIGRFLYRLSWTSGDGALERAEIVDVQVRASAPPTTLWLEDAPSFDTKYLKSWLADQGAKVAIRSRVSQGRYHFEFHNLEQVGLGRLDWDLLQRFDLLIVEQRAWENLTATEREVVRQAVDEAGMGVLLRLNPGRGSTLEPTWPWGFVGNRIPDIDHLMVRAQGAAATEASPIESPPFELRLDPAMTPIFTDRSGRVLAMTRPSGAGTVGVTLLRNTYSWVLEGVPEAHRSYWRRLIKAVARPDSVPVWRLPPGPILADEPLETGLEWSREGVEIPVARFGPAAGDQAGVAMRQDPVLASHWGVRVWPSSVGWHRLEMPGSGVDFYVADGDSWPTWQHKRRQRATRLASLRPTRSLPGTEVVVALPVPRLPFFLMLLISLGLLWLDERRGSPRAPRARR
jgi:hypothetical protein